MIAHTTLLEISCCGSFGLFFQLKSGRPITCHHNTCCLQNHCTPITVALPNSRFFHSTAGKQVYEFHRKFVSGMSADKAPNNVVVV